MSRFLGNLYRAYGYWHALTFGDACKLFLANYISFDMVVRPRGYSAPLFIRASTSDLPTFKQIFIARQYPLPEDKDISLIIDGGANVGYASVFFAEHFKQATIVAIEPEISNFRMLVKNTRSYPNIQCQRAGLWNRPASLSIANPKAEKFSFQLTEGGDGDGIPATTVGALLEAYRPSGKVLLKLDIEGAEKEVFSDCHDWIQKLDYVYLEIHNCWKDIFDRLTGCNYTGRISGEHVILRIRKDGSR